MGFWKANLSGDGDIVNDTIRLAKPKAVLKITPNLTPFTSANINIGISANATSTTPIDGINMKISMSAAKIPSNATSFALVFILFTDTLFFSGRSR
jgi:hypothetical protein